MWLASTFILLVPQTFRQQSKRVSKEYRCQGARGMNTDNTMNASYLIISTMSQPRCVKLNGAAIPCPALFLGDIC